MKGGGVVRFAIIDDEEYIRNQIRQLVETYCEEKRIPVDCICYKEAVTFLQEYRASFDAVFMDIKMPVTMAWRQQRFCVKQIRMFRLYLSQT